jgi:glycosyltransferase involved in cell wall biosynthesis
MRPLISIVSPVYNEHECIERLLDEIEQFFEKQLADRFDLEVLFVDDGSTDGATEIIRRLAREHPHVRAVLLSRNFGKQAAISAAYRHACGDAVLTVDSDLQHPLEACLEMVARWEEGYDVVYGVRDSQPAGFIKTACSRGFYRVFNLFSPTKIVPRVADFRLLSRTAVNALNQLPERCRWSPGLVSWLGFRSAKVCYALRPRAAGEPK